MRGSRTPDDIVTPAGWHGAGKKKTKNFRDRFTEEEATKLTAHGFLVSGAGYRAERALSKGKGWHVRQVITIRSAVGDYCANTWNGSDIVGGQKVFASLAKAIESLDNAIE